MDIPMWAAIHYMKYYCAAQSIVSRILHNRERQITAGSHHINDANKAALQGLLDKCPRLLPTLEAIKENG